MLYLDWRLAEDVQRFEVLRIHDTKLSLGANNAIKLSVRNRGRRRTALQVQDEPPVEFFVSERILSGEVNPRQTWQDSYQVVPNKRGDFQFGDVNLRWQGPFGLIIRQGKADAQSKVKVYPNLLGIRQYDLVLRRNRLQEMGLRHSRQFGEGTEFERLREYLPDDPYRKIDWKATARKARPITVEYQTDRSQNLMVLLDIGRMSQSPVDKIAKLDYVINTALLLAYVAIGKGDKVGLMTFADEIGVYLSPQQGKGQFYRILETLYPVRAQQIEPDFSRAISYLGRKLRKRSLVVIFTDLSGSLAIQDLIKNIAVLSKRSLPLVVTISDPKINAASTQHPQDSFGAYQRSVAAQFLDQRRVALDTLKYMGILTLDVPANQLSVSVVNRYLELKGKTLI
ncbi:MAG: DUF58 domain-containing protein [Chloroflexota bacterium]